MDMKFNSLLSIVLIPEIVALIVDNDRLDDIMAINEFYKSNVYDLLSKEETKIWHYSPLTIYDVERGKRYRESSFPRGIMYEQRNAIYHILHRGI